MTDHFTPANLDLAHEIIDRYPVKRSAMIPLLHLAQEQDGWVTEDAMRQIAELVGVTPAEVLGTCSFYEMFKRRPVGRFLINICGTLSCQLMGAGELIHHAERKLGITSGDTTPDGLFTLAVAECQAACTEAPCLQVNYRHRYRVTPEDFDILVDELRSEADRGEGPDPGNPDAGGVPRHGVLSLSRQHIPAERAAGPSSPTSDQGPPAWMPPPDAEEQK